MVPRAAPLAKVGVGWQAVDDRVRAARLVRRQVLAPPAIQELSVERMAQLRRGQPTRAGEEVALAGADVDRRAAVRLARRALDVCSWVRAEDGLLQLAAVRWSWRASAG